MARSIAGDSTDIFRLKKTRTVNDNIYNSFEGPYSTIGAAKTRKHYNNNYDSLTVQQLMPAASLDPEMGWIPYLEWVDVDV